MITGRLTVIFHEGKELIDKDMGKQDPFCTAEIKGEKLKTKTHNKGGTAPVWEQALLFNVKGADIKECIHIQAFDEDLISNDKIGRCDIPLKNLFEQCWEKKDGAWFQLVDFDNFKRIAGYIRLSIKWDGEHPSKLGISIAAPAAPVAASSSAPSVPAAAAASSPSVARPVTVQQPIVVQPPIVVQAQVQPAPAQQPPQVMYQPSYVPGYAQQQPQPVYGQPQPMFVQPQAVYMPVGAVPMYQQPVYQQPVYQQPVYQPVYQQPGQPMFQPQPGNPYYRQF